MKQHPKKPHLVKFDGEWVVFPPTHLTMRTMDLYFAARAWASITNIIGARHA